MILPRFLLFAFFLYSAASPVPRRVFSYPTGKSPKCIAIGDLNHDGRPDIVVGNEDGTVTVLLNDGNDSFHPAPGSPFQAGHLPNDIVIADMNRDGNPDLVIVNTQSPYLTILLGDGKGAFHPASGSPVNVHSNPHPHGIAVADFNGDGIPDVVTDSWADNQIELLLGDGSGSLRTPGKFFAVGRRPYERLRSADFNHDGNPDVVTTNLDDDTVSILLGDGKGGLHPAAGSPFPAGAKPWQVTIDDINHDGNPDLIVIPYDRDVANDAQIAVTVLLGDGKGGFRPMPTSPLHLTGCRGAASVAAGDLEGNGLHDIAVLCASSRNLLTFENQDRGQFAETSQAAPSGWGSVVIADLIGKGKNDLITADNEAGSITIYRIPQAITPLKRTH
ncbi:VCBS repeat-containing protein [Acidobacterium sp. S8]|uniref:FG-GAP repeat domain-containing protein n=1 Tax=Acidobacterium sp. S8 TaxID=1641854 RepID=UPI00131CED85|nr:VCBS repeat-containing protein [Acidobacterium sp. S8]